MSDDSRPLSRRELIEAREQFIELLGRDALEIEWQRFFATSPFVLARGLPLRLLPHEIVPYGRPGRSEPDFAIYPTPPSAYDYGVIELKRPSSRILSSGSRKHVITLSRDAATALEQARSYASAASHAALDALVLGSRTQLFVIMGEKDELARIRPDIEWIGRNVAGNELIVPYDGLLELFTATIPPQVHVLVQRGARTEVEDAFHVFRYTVLHIGRGEPSTVAEMSPSRRWSTRSERAMSFYFQWERPENVLAYHLREEPLRAIDEIPTTITRVAMRLRRVLDFRGASPTVYPEWDLKAFDRSEMQYYAQGNRDAIEAVTRQAIRSHVEAVLITQSSRDVGVVVVLIDRLLPGSTIKILGSVPLP